MGVGCSDEAVSRRANGFEMPRRDETGNACDCEVLWHVWDIGMQIEC
jgi:hypothetical protein